MKDEDTMSGGKQKFRIIKNEYFDIYYDDSNKKEVAKAARIRKYLIKIGFHLSDKDGHVGKIVCDQMLRTKIPKSVGGIKFLNDNR